MLKTDNRNFNSSRSLILRSLIFSLILNLPYLVEWFDYQGSSPHNFNDADETIYLRLALLFGEGKYLDALFYEHNQQVGFSQILGSYPFAALDLLVGIFGTFLNLSPTTLGLVLDLVFCFLSYFCFTLFFRQLTTRKGIADLSTVVTLCFPWMFSPTRYFHFDLPLIQHVAAPSFINHSTLPVLRAVHTQASYPFFALTLCFFICSILSPMRRRYAVLSGLMCGLSLYCYFFAWATLWAILLVFPLFLGKLLAPRRIHFKELTETYVWFAVSNLVVSIPSFYLLFAYKHKTEALGLAGQALTRQWFFSIEDFLVLILLLIISIRAKRLPSESKIILNFAMATIACEFLVMNIQPVLGTYLVPIHFLVFYTHPLLSGLVMLLLFDAVLRFSTLRKISNIVFALLISLAIWNSLRKVSRFTHDTEFDELVHFVQTSTPADAVVAMIPFHKPFDLTARYSGWRSDPDYLQALTGRHLLSHQWWASCYQIVPEEHSRRELALSWLYSGVVQPLQPCYKELIDTSPDRYFQQWVAMQLWRIETCSYLQSLQTSYRPCNILRDFKVSHVVWEPALGLSYPNWFDTLLQQKWQSSSGKYIVYEFFPDRALQHFCK